MRLLGAVLAGGQSRRFGSDKALALLDGQPLIVHVIARLRPQVDALVVVGRDHVTEVTVPDVPAPGLGPLGGLNAALAHAAANGFDAVLTRGCDLPRLPLNLVTRLGEGPAFATGQPLLAIWPAALAPVLAVHLAQSVDRSLRGWIAVTTARAVDLGPIANINVVSDLARLGE